MIDMTVQFIKSDYEAHRYRLVAEALGMLLSIGVAIIFALTTPAPPLLLCYTLWLLASGLLVTTSYSRGSVGLTVLYGLFLVVDSIGALRTLFA